MLPSKEANLSRSKKGGAEMQIRLSEDLPRRTFQNLLSETPAIYESSSKSEADWLCNRLGSPGTVTRLVTGPAAPEGYFRVKAATSDLFIKVLCSENAGGVARGEKVARYLFEQGARVIANLDVLPVTNFGQDFSLFVYPYMQLRAAQISRDSELMSVGRLLGRVHLLLRSYPDPEPVIEFTRSRIETLCHLQHRLIHGLLINAKIGGILRSICSQVNFESWLQSEPGVGLQIVHGDLTFGNVVFCPRDEAWLLDFEETLFLSPVIDLAGALDRFVLVHCSRPEEAWRRALQFLRGYSSAGTPVASLIADGRVEKALRFLYVRSLLLLAGMEDSGHQVPDGEWSKFLGLVDALKNWIPLLRELEALGPELDSPELQVGA